MFPHERANVIRMKLRDYYMREKGRDEKISEMDLSAIGKDDATICFDE